MDDGFGPFTCYGLGSVASYAFEWTSWHQSWFSGSFQLLFFADSLTSFDPKTGKGTVKYLRHEAMGGHAFSNTQFSWRKVGNNEFPATEYAADPVLPFSLEFVSDRTVRIKMETGTKGNYNEASLMLVKEPVALNNWAYSFSAGKHTYKSAHGSVVLSTAPWKIEFLMRRAIL